MLECLHAARLVFNESLGTGFHALNQGYANLKQESVILHVRLCVCVRAHA
jgi:hypothetical protein